MALRYLYFAAKLFVGGAKVYQICGSCHECKDESNVLKYEQDEFIDQDEGACFLVVYNRQQILNLSYHESTSSLDEFLDDLYNNYGNAKTHIVRFTRELIHVVCSGAPPPFVEEIICDRTYFGWLNVDIRSLIRKYVNLHTVKITSQPVSKYVLPEDNCIDLSYEWQVRKIECENRSVIYQNNEYLCQTYDKKVNNALLTFIEGCNIISVDHNDEFYIYRIGDILEYVFEMGPRQRCTVIKGSMVMVKNHKYVGNLPCGKPVFYNVKEKHVIIAEMRSIVKPCEMNGNRYYYLINHDCKIIVANEQWNTLMEPFYVYDFICSKNQYIFAENKLLKLEMDTDGGASIAVIKKYKQCIVYVVFHVNIYVVVLGSDGVYRAQLYDNKHILRAQYVSDEPISLNIAEMITRGDRALSKYTKIMD